MGKKRERDEKGETPKERKEGRKKKGQNMKHI